jgi:hypothetical protein
MNPKRRGSRSDAVRLVARIREAVDRSADTAESIHKRVAHLPLAPFEGVEPLEAACKDMRRIQDRSIGAVYDLVRDVNHELVRLVEEWLAREPRRPKRRVPPKRARAAPSEAA